jgi:hypothetical protein
VNRVTVESTRALDENTAAVIAGNEVVRDG